MAGPIRIAVTADSRQANSELSRTARTAQKVGGAFKKAALPAAAALAGIAKGAFDAAQAAAADASAQKNLAQTLKTTTDATRKQITANEEWIATQGKLLGVTDDELRPAIGQLATATGSISKAQKLAAIAMDISARRGVSLESVTKKLAKAQTTGSATALAQYGVKTKDAAGKTRDLSAVVGELANKYRGAASSAANTAAGKQKRFQVALGELQEQIGAGLLPIMGKLVGFGLKVVGFFQRNEQVAKILVIALGAVAVAILAVNAAMLLNPAVLIVAGIVLLVGALVLAYKRSEDFRNICDQVASFVRTSVVPALKEFGSYIVGTVIPALVRLAQDVAARLKPILEQLATTFQTKVVPTAQKVAAKFREMWPQIKQVASFVIQAVGAFIRFAAKVAGKVIPVLIRFAGFVISKVVPAVVDIIGIIVRVIARAIAFGRAFVDTIKRLAEWVRGVKDKGGQVLSYVRSIPGKVVNALGDLVSKLVSKGKDLITGMLNGIKEGVQDAISYVSGIPGMLSGALGGGRLNYDFAINTIRSTTYSDTPSVSTGRPGGGRLSAADVYAAQTSGRTAAPIIINVTAPVGSSPADIGRSLSHYLDAYTSVGGRRVAR